MGWGAGKEVRLIGQNHSSTPRYQHLLFWCNIIIKLNAIKSFSNIPKFEIIISNKTITSTGSTDQDGRTNHKLFYMLNCNYLTIILCFTFNTFFVPSTTNNCNYFQFKLMYFLATAFSCFTKQTKAAGSLFSSSRTF